jgi:DNA-directed RNA polymerase subunit alpha
MKFKKWFIFGYPVSESNRMQKFSFSCPVVASPLDHQSFQNTLIQQRNLKTRISKLKAFHERTCPVGFEETSTTRKFALAESLDFRVEKNLHYGKFSFSGLQKGQGLTIANALRRILLYDIQGIGITHVQFSRKNSEKIYHEFSTIPGIRESILDILMNLRLVVWGIRSNTETNTTQKTDFEYKKEHKAQVFLGNFLDANQTTFVLQAKHLEIPKNTGLFIVNPEQYLATIVLPSLSSQSTAEQKIQIQELQEIAFEYIVRNGDEQEFPESASSKFLATDGNFLPIKKVNYSVQEALHGETLIGNNEKLTDENVFFEIWTNGSLHPKAALTKSLESFLFLFQELKISLQTENSSQGMSSKT